VDSWKSSVFSLEWNVADESASGGSIGEIKRWVRRMRKLAEMLLSEC